MVYKDHSAWNNGIKWNIRVRSSVEGQTRISWMLIAEHYSRAIWEKWMFQSPNIQPNVGAPHHKVRRYMQAPYGQFVYFVCFPTLPRFILFILFLKVDKFIIRFVNPSPTSHPLIIPLSLLLYYLLLNFGQKERTEASALLAKFSNSMNACIPAQAAYSYTLFFALNAPCFCEKRNF